jgi:hypothetical protein
MEDSGALPGEMSRRLDFDPLPLDPQTAERILAGSVSPADVPPGYADVARVMRAVAGPPAPAELAGEVEAVALLAAEFGAHSTNPTPRRSSVPSRSLSLRFAVATVAGALSLTTGLAAADVLPDAAQDVASTVLDKVGISVPDGDSGVTMTIDTDATVDAGVSTTTSTTSDGDSDQTPPAAPTTGEVTPNVLSPTGVPADDADDDGDDAADDDHGQAGQGMPSGFAKQIEHCQEQGQTKQARFQEQGKTKQYDKAGEQAAACQEKFENKKDESADPPTTTTPPANQGNSNSGHVDDDDQGDDNDDQGDVSDDDGSDHDDDQGDDNHDDAHPPADPGSNGHGNKKGHDHAPGQSGRQ